MIASRFRARFMAQRVVQVDPRRATPTVRRSHAIAVTGSLSDRY